MRKKDDRNLELSSKNKDRKSPEASDNEAIIFDEKVNTIILDFRLKKITFYS